MRNRTKTLLGAAALAAIPAAANAVTITYSIDPTLLYSATRTGSYTAVPAGDISTSGTTTTVTLPSADAGYYFQFGVDGAISNLSSGSAAVLGAVGQSATGLAGFSFGVSDSNPSTASIFASKSSNASGTALSTPVITSPPFAGASASGLADGAGGILQNAGLAGNLNVGSLSAERTYYNVGTSAPQQLASGIEIGSVATGTASFTVLPYNPGTSYLAFTGGTKPGTSSSKYQQDGFTALDSAAPSPSLKIVIGGAIVTTHPIISLTSGSTPVTGYGPADGTLAVTTAGPGDYTPTAAASFTTATTGSVAVTQFNGTDPEIYALKLDSNGTPLTAAQINTIIADINGTNGLTNASTGVVASTITGIYATDFPSSSGFNILLTANPGVTNPAELGFDFSSAGEQDTAVPGVTVVGVSAVPEPATAASIVLGAAGLLLGRRRNKLTLA